jgi:phytoene dehydrogenase-like protein
MASRIAGRRFDVVVVGSGIGGLTAGMTAARAGLSVLVLEAAKQYGGYCNPFRRGHYRFDPGLHYIGECGPGQQLSRMLEKLDMADAVRFRELSPDAIDRLVFPGYEVRMPKGPDRYRERLAADFPHQRAALDRFFALLAEFRAAVRAINHIAPTLGSLIEVARRVPFLARYLRASFADLLDPIIEDPLLRAVLAAQSGDYGLPPSRASALIGLGLLDHYLYGAYFPVGGSGALRDAFVHGIERLGGELHRNTPVDRILLKGGRAAGVRTRAGEEIEAGVVISNADATRTLREMVGVDRLPWLAQQRTARVTLSTASVCLFIGTDLDLSQAGMTDTNIWSYPTVDFEQFYGPILRGEMPDQDFFFVSSPSLKDPEGHGGDPGHQTLEVVTLAPFAPFARWEGMKSMRRGPEYEALKQKLGERYLAAAERFVPGLGAHVKVMEVATPVTNVTYATAPRGSIYGPEATPGQMGPFRYAVKSAVDGLFLCGASTLGGGVVPAALSGFQAGKLAAKALGAARPLRGARLEPEVLQARP